MNYLENTPNIFLAPDKNWQYLPTYKVGRNKYSVAHRKNKKEVSKKGILFFVSVAPWKNSEQWRKSKEEELDGISVKTSKALLIELIINHS